MAAVKRLLWLVLGVVTIAGCKDKAANSAQPTATPTATPTTAPTPTPEATPAPTQGMAHTDHTGKHGGLVQMFGDLHTETVFGADGKHALHLSGPTREPWPAATIVAPVFIIKRPGAEPERLELSAAADGSHWSGQGKPLAEPRTMVRLEFTWKDTPQFIEIPAMLAAPEALPAPPDDHSKHQH